MRLKVEESVRSITAILREWPSVDTVTMLLSGEDVYDAYFFVSLDVYSAGDIPDENARSKLFAHTGAFESSSISRKDRFLLDDIPFQPDILITMGCGVVCPFIPSRHREDWGIEDPAGKSIEEFRKTRDIIKNKVQELVKKVKNAELS